MESKQLKIKYKDCQPYKLLSGLYPVFNDSLRRMGIQDDVQLILNVNADYRHLHIYTDAERLKQVISNLVNNAIKFTDTGFIEYGFKLWDRDQLKFFVRDSGIGIPEKMKDKIFDRFYQLEEHQQKNHGGAGLGLAICKNIINLLGGTIWMESDVEEGSCFYFQIPIRDVPEKLKSISQIKNDISKPNWSNKRIIVAEDDHINFVYIQEVLSRCGAKVIHAKNGTEAIDLAELGNRIDLILMDIKMPEIDGLEASRYISKARPEVPIIALTAFAMEGDKSKCLRAGCIDYISKPIKKKELYTIVDKYIHIERANPSRDAVKIK
jgi:two-component system CheB/CheR fusion protein